MSYADCYGLTRGERGALRNASTTLTDDQRIAKAKLRLMSRISMDDIEEICALLGVGHTKGGVRRFEGFAAADDVQLWNGCVKALGKAPGVPNFSCF